RKWEFPSLESPALSGQGRSKVIKHQHVARGLSNSAKLVSSMKLYLQSVCQLGFLALCCVLITVRESDGTFVPGRCMCPQTQQVVRGNLTELMVYPKSPGCDKVTVIVTLINNKKMCLNPEAPIGKQLIRCWKR
ncbi:hypothetical protein L3Q82_011806, partial [Scortum barcoo]